ncbi:MAG: hypothetical protein IT542_11770 [Rubellimicrobium sp.]|nr:hypothetical protein [Rubellimicrobium sp.]
MQADDDGSGDRVGAAGATAGRIVSFRNDRLGGRLTSLVNAMRLARVLGAELIVHWHETEDHGAVFNDPAELFDPAFIARHFIDRPAYEGLGERLGLLDGRVEADAMRARLAGGENLLVERAIGLIVLAGEDPAAVADEAGAIWARLPFAAALGPPMAAIRAALGDQAVAYHIRRGDIVSNPRVIQRPWPTKFIIDEVFETHIARSCAGGERPVLFSDDPGAVERFVARFPAALRGSDLVAATGITAGQRDLLEMYAMAQCHRIVAPPGSAFSGTAATLGRGRLIDVTRDLSPAEVDRAYGALVARLQGDMPAALAESRGKVGQSLVHVVRRAQAHGANPAALREAADLVQSAIGAGAQLSFLWWLAGELLMRLGDEQAVIALSQLVERNPPHHGSDLARLRAFAALGLAAQGRKARAAALIVMALPDWADLPLVARVAGLFYRLGILRRGNALMLSPAAAALPAGSAGPLTEIPAFRRLAATVPADRRGRIEDANILALSWDWAPLLRHIPPGGLARHPRHAAWDRRMARVDPDRHGADARSLAAIYAIHRHGAAALEGALSELRALAQAAPRDAMVAQRLSHAALIARDHALYRETAENAAELAANSAGHLAWRGIARLRGRNPEGALADLEAAIGRGLLLPIVFNAAAQAAGALGDPLREGEFLDRAVRVTPRNGTQIMARRDYRLRMGDHAGAKADLALALSLQVPPPRALELGAAARAGGQ